MQLVLDIGNTAIKAAWFNGKELLEVRVVSEQISEAPDFFDSPARPEKIMLASVRASDPVFLRNFSVPVHRLSDQTPLPFINSYRTPQTLGADLSRAVLDNANLSNAVLDNANLGGADGITNEELEQQAVSLEGADMPNGQKYEDWLKDREGRREDE